MPHELSRCRRPRHVSPSHPGAAGKLPPCAWSPGVERIPDPRSVAGSAGKCSCITDLGAHMLDEEREEPRPSPWTRSWTTGLEA
ncbi:hypothetical protein ACRAWF_20030 [Streptomyces sp. L7]